MRDVWCNTFTQLHSHRKVNTFKIKTAKTPNGPQDLFRLLKAPIFNFLGRTFFSHFIQSRVFLSISYLTVADLARLGISVFRQVSAICQCLVRFLSLCWITTGHTIHPPIEALLLLTGIEPTLFRNLASKVSELQIYATTPGFILQELFKMRLKKFGVFPV